MIPLTSVGRSAMGKWPAFSSFTYREPGTGRPTKRERREVDRLMEGWETR